jgi:hypothetical protein
MRGDPVRRRQWLAILLVSMAGLLLEVSYTRIVSFKLWYYYTYLVIGLALLGIGSGGVLVAVFAPMRRWSTDRILAVCAMASAGTTLVGYVVLARVHINTTLIWDYGTRTSLKNLAVLALISFVLFATFIAFGVIVAVLLGRAGDRVGRLYFGDLLGAGIGCLIAIPLIVHLGPPRTVALAAVIFAGVATMFLAKRPALLIVGSVVTIALAGVVASSDVLPDVRVEDTKLDTRGALFSEWGPVFRVDVLQFFADQPDRLLVHDGTFGSGIRNWDGNIDSLSRYQFDKDPRAIPFQVLGDAPERELIIGSAGGQEILASLWHDAANIEAVELNPVTVSLLTDHFADWTGNLPDRPEVDLHLGDGRSYLARSAGQYGLVWYVAPDSYAATNAASSGAFVLSESYLYTSEMIRETLEHLSDDGIMVVQFGEVDFENYPNRTGRYILTARKALESLGIEDPSRHLLVAGQVERDQGDFATIIVKRSAFTEEEIDRFTAGVSTLPKQTPIYAPGRALPPHLVNRLAGGSDAEVRHLAADYALDISPISDDAPFFWHFAQFDDVIRNIFEPMRVSDPENAIGERVLLLLLALAIVYAAVFLLLPFVLVRRQWLALPSKRASAVYFAALGLGFMFFEITMIQRLTLFLGYPTYSLTVTLAAILVSTGVGALLSARLAARVRGLLPLLCCVLAALTIFYQFGLDSVFDSLLAQSLGVRLVIALLVLLPLGVCLGMFMPVGLARVVQLTDQGEQYVAWAWAVNGFFSVIGSVLTTILSMSFGFHAVQYAALGFYLIAAVAFSRLRRPPEPVPTAAAADRVLVRT